MTEHNTETGTVTGTKDKDYKLIRSSPGSDSYGRGSIPMLWIRGIECLGSRDGIMSRMSTH